MNWNWLLPEGNGIPVLMYHKVWPGLADGLTIMPTVLREQWEYLKEEGFHTLSLTEYLDVVTEKKKQPQKSILITFDDGYRNNLQYAYPLLKELGFKATLFIIGNTLDGTAKPEKDAIVEKMTPAELASLDPEVAELAMHGYMHEDFSKMSMGQISTAIDSAKQAFDNSRLPYHKVWGYAYGARPADMRGMQKIMRDAGIKAAFRIGNKVSKVPADNIYELKRIDVKGTDTMEEFKIKLRKGRLKPF